MMVPWLQMTSYLWITAATPIAPVSIAEIFFHAHDCSNGLNKYIGAASDFGRENHSEIQLGTSSGEYPRL